MSSLHGYYRVRPCQGVPCIACLNLKTYGYYYFVFISPPCCCCQNFGEQDLNFFILSYATATFWTMSPVGIYPGWASIGPASDREQKGKGFYCSLRHFEILYFNVVHLCRNGLEMPDKRKR